MKQKHLQPHTGLNVVGKWKRRMLQVHSAQSAFSATAPPLWNSAESENPPLPQYVFFLFKCFWVFFPRSFLWKCVELFLNPG